MPILLLEYCDFRATPTIPHPNLSLLLFWQKQKKPSGTVPHLMLPFIPSGKN
jgi:hypothetical protein